MKRILTAAIILTLISCEGHIKIEKPDYIELGNVRTRLEIRKQDGKYVGPLVSLIHLTEEHPTQISSTQIQRSPIL